MITNDWDSFDPKLLESFGQQPDDSTDTIAPPVCLAKLIVDHPRMRPPVIDGILREGETMNLIASPKTGKSWLSAGLAIDVATGGNWLSTFPCTPGRVLVIDAELHPETIAHRYPLVADAMGVSPRRPG